MYTGSVSAGYPTQENGENALGHFAPSVFFCYFSATPRGIQSPRSYICFRKEIAPLPLKTTRGVLFTRNCFCTPRGVLQGYYGISPPALLANCKLEMQLHHVLHAWQGYRARLSRRSLNAARKAYSPTGRHLPLAQSSLGPLNVGRATLLRLIKANGKCAADCRLSLPAKIERFFAMKYRSELA